MVVVARWCGCEVDSPRPHLWHSGGRGGGIRQHWLPTPYTHNTHTIHSVQSIKVEAYTHTPINIFTFISISLSMYVNGVGQGTQAGRGARPGVVLLLVPLEAPLDVPLIMGLTG